MNKSKARSTARTTVSFYTEVYQRLEERTKQKGLASVGQSIRELVDLGLRIEDATKSNDKGAGDELLDAILDLKNLFKNNLNWSLETRLLTRLLVGQQADPTQKISSEILKECQERAQQYVQGLLGEITT
jgi:hypothetical protein